MGKKVILPEEGTNYIKNDIKKPSLTPVQLLELINCLSMPDMEYFLDFIDRLANEGKMELVGVILDDSIMEIDKIIIKNGFEIIRLSKFSFYLPEGFQNLEGNQQLIIFFENISDVLISFLCDKDELKKLSDIKTLLREKEII